MSQMPKLRNINQCHAWLLENDPDLPMTVSMLRKLVTEGSIPSVRSGRKILIDLNVLPVAISDWVKAEQERSAEITKKPEKSKPVSAVERASGGGKYGQIRTFG